VAEGEALYLLHDHATFVAEMLPLFDFTGCDEAMKEHFLRGDPLPPPS
jgi:hypothetical protein